MIQGWHVVAAALVLHRATHETIISRVGGVLRQECDIERFLGGTALAVCQPSRIENVLG